MNRFDMTLGRMPVMDNTASSLDNNGEVVSSYTGMIIENPIGLQVTLISQGGKMQGLFLTYPAKGNVHFQNQLVDNIPVHFEASNGKWYAVREASARYISHRDPFETRVLICNQDLLMIRNGESLFMLYVEEVNEDSFVRHNYVALPSDLYIGRTEDNDIVYGAPMISGRHAVLHYNGMNWSIQDLESRNGIYVNGYRVRSMLLGLGDVIDIFGLRIIIGSRFISINDGNNRVIVSPRKARLVSDTNNVMSNVLPEEKKENIDMFNRYPRKRLAFGDYKIDVDNPPMPLNDNGIPLIMRMGSSMIMGGTAALTGNVSMLANSVLLPLLSQGYSKEEKEEYEERRQEKYREYLLKKEDEIFREKEREEYVLRSNYPELPVVLEYVHEKRNLWARAKNDDDFLHVRIGRGNVPLKAEMNYAKERFDMEDDELKEEMYELVNRKVLLEDVPMMLDLINDFVIGVQGDTEDIAGFINTLIMRMSVLFSYDEVKLVLLLDEEQLEAMEYVKYLPHVWDDQRMIRFIATNASEAYQVGEYIQKELEKDLEHPRKWEQISSERPYYIVFALNKKLLDGVEVFKQTMQCKESIGVSLIAGFMDVPKECSILLEINKTENEENYNKIIYVRELDRDDDYFIQDDFEEENAWNSMRILGNTNLKLLSQAYALPKSLSFLEMFGVGRIEDLNIAERWRTNDPVTSLAVPIGISTEGSDFMLDLHQRYQGPHGLVAGTTGSGKSEFLLTYILSLAVNFHPDEVAFLLIDYKGGGLAGAFDDPLNKIHLPHLIGTITNLDGAAINRSLVSIQSEMLRRQKVFNEAKSTAGEGTMDIYTYQRLYRTGVVKTPMPHLFIISDEFAELKQQQPDFLDQLVSIARIGRSLGVHLILATQKPSGVVTDQILSNTKFRVCLKVQDRADSMDMLKRPEASEIRETGRFYLQVGNNEFFALGQSAWSGAEYEPQDEVVKQKDQSIQVIDCVGSTIMTVKPEVEKKSSGRSQLVSIVKNIMDIANEQKIESTALWLPVLPDKISVEEGAEDNKQFLNTYIGLLDDPAKQKQYPLYLDLLTCGHILICGAAGSGKTTFLETFLYSMVKKHTPDEFQFYILDYSSKLLKLFRNLPHCGAVLEEEQEEQSVELFRMINNILQERKALFSKLEVSSYSEAVKVTNVPFIVVVIDNIAGYLQTKSGQKQYDFLKNYLKNSGNYGISYIVTMNHVNELNMRTRQEFKQRIALQLKDKYEYTDVLEIKSSYCPPAKSGRGIYNYDGEALEMQLAMFEPELEQKERIQALKREIEKFVHEYKDGGRAKQLLQIQPNQEYKDFMLEFAKNRLPLGYNLRTSKPIALPLKQFNQLSVYFSNREAPVPVLSNFVSYAKQENMVVTMLKKKSESCCQQLGLAEDARIFDMNAEGVEQFSLFLLANANHRYSLYEKYCNENGLDVDSAIGKQEVFLHMRESFRPIFVLIEKYSDLVSLTMEIKGYVSKFSSLYLLAKYCQIYIVAMFYDDEPAYVWGNELYTCFNPAKLAMLFGEKLKQQRIVQLPYDVEKLLLKKDFNQFIMCYRNELYHLMMPCGEIKKDTTVSDDDSIFGDA